MEDALSPPAAIALAVLASSAALGAAASSPVRARLLAALPGLGPRGHRAVVWLAAAATFLALAAWSALLDDRTVYTLGPPWSWALRLGQLAGVALIAAAARAGGPAALFPPAQGAAARGAGGPYARVRHPAILGVWLCLWLTPAMTVNRAAFALAATVALAAASVAVERARRTALGEAYLRYRSIVPRFFPQPGARWTADPRE